MTFHTEIMMIRWVVTAQKPTIELLRNIKKIPLKERYADQRVINVVKMMKYKWERATKIERLAILGWNEYEACVLLSNIIENLENLLTEYNEELKNNGGVLPDLKNEQLEEYEKCAELEIKKQNIN